MKRCKAALAGKRHPHYLLLRTVRVDVPIDTPIPCLGGLHDRAMEHFSPRYRCAVRGSVPGIAIHPRA